MHTFSSLTLLLVTLLSLLTLVSAASIGPSPTPRRRSPGPLPTSIEQVTDPDLLALLANVDPSSGKSLGSTHGTLSRSRSRKIKGFGHEADQLPLTNAERIRLGIPLKPPAAKKSTTASGPQEGDEFEMEDREWDWLEAAHSF